MIPTGIPSRSDQQGAARQLQRVWQPRGDDVGDRHVLNDERPEIEAGELFQVGEVLHDERTVEAERRRIASISAWVAVSGTSR